MRKILLLGGSAQQITAITTAKRLGYYTVLCDYLPDNPGQYCADKFYLISTTDKEAVLKVAEKEEISGVLAYASDPAAPTAAYIAEKMVLPTSPLTLFAEKPALPTGLLTSVETLCDKVRFREFLRSNGFNAPKSCGYEDIKSAVNDIGRFRLPIIIKPADSSGSKGVTVVSKMCEACKESSSSIILDAVKLAFSFSPSHRIIIEEFIENGYPFLIGGDIFVYNGSVVFWGLMNCLRDSRVNPLVPAGKSWPLKLRSEDMNNVKRVLQEIVDRLHIKTCEMNVELIVDKEGKVWPIDIGPRCGGNMIPEFLGMIYGIDLVELTVKSAMGEDISEEIRLISAEGYSANCFASYNLHCAADSIYKGIEYSEEIRLHIVKEFIYKKAGDKIEYFDNASKAIGIVFLKFDSQEDMDYYLNDIEGHIHINCVRFSMKT